MKQDIEKLFQDALSNAELPYDSGAWEAMSSRLGPQKPPSAKGKWYFSAAAVAVIGGVIAIVSAGRSREAKPVLLSENTVTSSKAVEQQPAAGAETTQGYTNRQSVSQPGPEQPVQHETDRSEANMEPLQPERNPKSDQQVAVPVERMNPLPKENADKPENKGGTPKLSAVSLPASICAGEPLTIVNPNTADLWIKMPGETSVKALKAGQKITLSAEQPGNLIVNNGEITQKVVVNPVVNAEIIGSDQILYENGIPQLTFSVSAKLDNVSWSSDAPGSDSRDGYIVYPYHNDRVTVQIKGTDQNGCKVTETRTIDLAEKHNLLAPEAFRPEGSIPANQFFMPFALVQRETPFELMIFDVKNGAQVFATKDASKGWDGRDSRNGELVPTGSIWVWKVILKSPRPGENPVYSGTITRL